MTMSLSPEDRAIRAICTKNFHQALWLPETADHPKLKVTYSTTTNFDDVDLPAVLFIGPMFGTRWSSLHFDKLARDSGVRLICVDRPSFGGSTPVTIDIRMRVWLETVPVLLQKVGVKHVALMTHSAGTIYTLNTLIHHRHFLDPRAPYAGFMSPYAPFAHTGATLPTVAAKLPTGLLDSWAGLTTFVNTKVVPSAAWSGGIISSCAALFSFSGSTEVPGSEASTTTTLVEQYGFDNETAEIIAKLSIKFQFAESNMGGNEEAKLCLCKCDDADWGDAADYSGCIRKIAANEAARSGGRPKLRIEAFFAASDVMTARRGQEFIEQCWQNDEVKGKVDFATTTLPDTNHDSVLIDYEKGALRTVFERIAELHGNSESR
ncbi:hypothetical protein K461DRAFT_248700, partial [Myriangium duriaei CBS 260.36]